jgi:uncharacterized membrane protein
MGRVDVEWPRVAAIAVGAGLAAGFVAVRNRRTGDDVFESGQGLHLIESVTINRPAAELFQLWRNPPDVTVLHEIESELISWRSRPGAPIESAGSVRFTARARGGTQIAVVIQYRPPIGPFSGPFAWLGRRSPSARLREDLRRLKQLLEAGEEPTTHGQPSGARSLLFGLARHAA